MVSPKEANSFHAIINDFSNPLIKISKKEVSRTFIP